VTPEINVENKKV